MSSLYSTTIRPDYIDPKLDQQNKRMVFELGGGGVVYYSNLRLVNLGATILTTADNVNGLAGLYGLIKHAHLLDGATVIESVREAGRLLAFKNINNSNDVCYSVNAKLSKAPVGYVLEDSGTVDIGFQATAPKFDHRVKPVATDTDADSAYLDLRMLFSSLSQMQILDTALMPNLRIVLELSTTLTDIVNKDNRGALTTKPAILVADEVINPEAVAALRKGFKAVQYSSYEHDVVSIPAGTRPAAGAGNAPATQSVTARIKGFDNKLIDRVLVMKAYSDETKYTSAINANTTLGFGRLTSVAMMGEKVQFKHNGSAVFPENGLDSPAKIASQLSQAYGDVNMIPFGNETSMGLNIPGTCPNTIGGPAVTNGGNDDNERVGQESFIGWELGDRVNSLAIEYERKIPADSQGGGRTLSSESAGLNLHVYAEVVKQLIADGQGGYTVKYV